MKYRLMGLLVCLLALVTAVAAHGGEAGGSTRYHQHREEAGYTPCTDHGSAVFCTHLPLVLLETGGQEIPGAPYRDGDGVTQFTTAADGSTTIPATMRVIDTAGENHHLTDAASLESQITIRIRGNSSRYFDKKSYLVHLMEEDGITSRDASVMGMDAFDEWALYGPYLDKTLIRNYMWYNIAGEIMDWAPNVRYCEVFLDGVYQGLYVMTETVSSGENSRLDLSKPLDRGTATGYVLRLDRGSSVEEKNITTFSQYTLRNLQKLDIVYPGTKKLLEYPGLSDWIAQDFSDFEKALYSYDYDESPYAWWDWADEDSFVDYFILNEFTCNYDAGQYSTYIYRDIAGKYRLCIWDFNSACNNYIDDMVDPESFQMQNRVWFTMLVKDERFVNAVLRRYGQLRQGWLSDETLEGYMDEVAAWLGPAIDRNFAAWPGNFTEYRPMTPDERNPDSYEDALGQLKGFCRRRGAWMDENIHTLLQYCHESRVKKFNH